LYASNDANDATLKEIYYKSTITKSSYQNSNFKIKAKLAIEYLANSAAYPVHLPSTGLRRQTAGKIASNCPANVGNHKPQYGQRMAGAQISVSQRLLRYH